MVCIGNHEYDYIGQPFSPKGYGYGTDSGGECGIPYLKRFRIYTCWNIETARTAKPSQKNTNRTLGLPGSRY